MKRLLPAFFLIAIGWSSIAQPSIVSLQTSPSIGSGGRSIADPGPGGSVTVYVLLSFTTGASKVSFSAPVPVYAGLQWVGDTVQAGFTVVGDSQTRADVSFSPCMSGSIVVMEMHFIRVGNAESCVPYSIQPGSLVFDCSLSNQSSGDYSWNIALNSVNNCNSVPYRHPYPSDGATNVPLSTVLNWDDLTYFSCVDPIAAVIRSPSASGLVYFGATSPPPYDAAATYYHGVGPLQPGTTYYWQIAQEQGRFVASPLWSFTTASLLATRPSTWGAIKALYR